MKCFFPIANVFLCLVYSNDGSLAVMWNEWYAHKCQIVSRKLNKLLFFSMMCASPGRVYFAHFVLSQTTINSDATLLWSNISVRCDNVTPFLRCLLNFTCDNEILRQHCKHFAIYSKTPLQWFNYMLTPLTHTLFLIFFLFFFVVAGFKLFAKYYYLYWCPRSLHKRYVFYTVSFFYKQLKIK